MLDRAIQYAVAAARCGSFTAAAERMGVTQSAITKRIAELEQRLGYSIFNRTARGIILTEDGRTFTERASRIVEDLGDLMRMSRQRDPFAVSLRIGVCPASLEWLLAKPVADLLRRHPQVRFDVTGSTFERMVQQLRNGSVDVVLGFEDAFAEQPEFKREKLAPLETIYFVRKSHPLAEEKDVSRAALAQFAFVTPSVSQPYGSDIYDIFESQGLHAASRVHAVDHFALVSKIVENSDAIGVVSLHYARSTTFETRFEAIDLKETIRAASLCCATRARWDPSQAVRQFIQACRAAMPSRGN